MVSFLPGIDVDVDQVDKADSFAYGHLDQTPSEFSLYAKRPALVSLRASSRAQGLGLLSPRACSQATLAYTDTVSASRRCPLMGALTVTGK